MLKNFINSSLCPNPVLLLLDQQLGNQILRLWRHSYLMPHWVGEGYHCFLYKEEHLMFILVEERWNADKHFVKQDSKRPQVNCVIVSLAFQHFWGEVLSCTTE